MLKRHFVFIPFFVFLIFLGGCRVHRPWKLDRPCVCIPEQYYNDQEGTRVVENWWEEFNEPVLNCLVETSLKNNLDIAQAWNRLCQAKAQAIIDGADRYPQINMVNSVFNTNTAGRTGAGFGAPGISIPGVPITDIPGVASSGSLTNYFLSFDLSYEVDLWKRIDSRTKAGLYNVLATCEDLEATALILTGTVTDLWFTVQEQQALLELFAEQIKANETLLELVELRFSIGDASALDVYQQRLQLAQTESQVPPVESLFRTASNQLYVLLGEPPSDYYNTKTGVLFQKLPPFPQMGTPMDLICHRPDLRATQRKLKQADYQVAEAVADQFPKLSVLLSYDFSALRFRDIFDRELITIASNFVYPLVDGGRRAAEVDRRKAIVWERLNAFGEGFLNALKEVEDATVEERFQLDLIQKLHHQTEVAEANLREARIRYMNGLSDYLPVITAVQSLQEVQRRDITARKRLLQFRSKLYRALGGTCLVANCQP